MIKYGFIFHHINYSRYLAYQQVYLRSLQSKRSKIVADLDEQSLGGCFTGLPFTSLHGNLITEIFNSQTKQQAGPNAAGFSININNVSDSIQLTRIHAKLRVYLPRKLNCELITNSCHKECTPCVMKLHVPNVESLKQQLRIYGCDPFAEINAGDIVTGEELPKGIIKIC